jgi:hypothetical protein
VSTILDDPDVEHTTCNSLKSKSYKLLFVYTRLSVPKYYVILGGDAVLDLLQEMVRETKSPRPLCRKQEFIMLAESEEISSESPEPPSESGDGLCTPGG